MVLFRLGKSDIRNSLALQQPAEKVDRKRKSCLPVLVWPTPGRSFIKVNPFEGSCATPMQKRHTCGISQLVPLAKLDEQMIQVNWVVCRFWPCSNRGPLPLGWMEEDRWHHGHDPETQSRFPTKDIHVGSWPIAYMHEEENWDEEGHLW